MSGTPPAADTALETVPVQLQISPRDTAVTHAILNATTTTTTHPMPTTATTTTTTHPIPTTTTPTPTTITLSSLFSASFQSFTPTSFNHCHGPFIVRLDSCESHQLTFFFLFFLNEDNSLRSFVASER